MAFVEIFEQDGLSWSGRGARLSLLHQKTCIFWYCIGCKMHLLPGPTSALKIQYQRKGALLDLNILACGIGASSSLLSLAPFWV